MIFHVANSWQEGKDKDIIKLYACCFEEVPCNSLNPQVNYLHPPEQDAMLRMLLHCRTAGCCGKERFRST